MRNLIYVGHARLYAAVVTGVLAGVLQLENLWGFFFYLGLCVVGLTAVVVSSRENLSPVGHVAMESIFSGLFTFCLFWVLAFNVSSVYGPH